MVVQHTCLERFHLIGDHFDNDCDGRVDEELMDGADNDGDGLIDEDTHRDLYDYDMTTISTGVRGDP